MTRNAGGGPLKAKLGQIENECWGGSANQCNKEDKIGSPDSLLLLCAGGSTINSLHGVTFISNVLAFQNSSR